MLGICILLSACAPTVQVAVPNEPITINLNVKIEHEILVKVDKEIDDLFTENSDLF
nr:YnbE family lipoprotein [Aliamphritea spongicola]